MKKIILLVLLFLICGCSKRLTCSYEQNYEDIKINNKIVFDLKSNKYNQQDIMVFKDNESALNYFNDIEEYKDEYNLKLEENKIISDINGEINLDTNEKELKEKYESYDYKCR